ncbi:hypothetical protein EC988_005280 [Linderina pennispora]|nr:hypothetical protein EC988_005280 [Linderina pennispora]
MFFGGLMLTTVVGYIWLSPRMKQTEELQSQLRKVQTHMYWSMALTQRTRLEETAGETTAPRRVIWWNARVGQLFHWAGEPGYLTAGTQKTCRLVNDGLEYGAGEVKRAISSSSEWATDTIKEGVEQSAVVKSARLMWEDEKRKWRVAHADAIEAVHPLYQKPEDP